MEGLLQQISAFSNNPAEQQPLLTTLKNAEALLQQNQAQLPQALQILDPAAHSLGVVYILHSLCKGNLNPQGDAFFIDSCSRFLQVCSGPQVQLAAEPFCAVCKKYKEQVVALGNPRQGIVPLLAALRALQPSPDVLTPIHADFFQLCLLARCCNAAAGVLSEDIFDVAPSITSCTPTDLFLYCYYGGMLCIGRKQHARALELFLQALTAPAIVGNAIVLAAYKKYVLACLIHAGALLPLPKFTSSRVKQLVDSDARPYQELALAYASRNLDKLRRAAEQHQQVFAADNNVGLIRQVLSSVTVRSIQRLTQTYLTLSTAAIAQNVGLANAEEAEAYILRMVAAGQIQAHVDGRTGMVRFSEDNAAAAASTSTGGGAGASGGGWDNAEAVAQLDSRIRQVLALNQRLAQANDMVSTDRAYLNKITAKERSKYDLGSLPEEFGMAAAAAGSQGMY